MSTIDITPTWKGLVPVLLEIVRENRNGAIIAIEEITRMAEIADAHKQAHDKFLLVMDLLHAACEALAAHDDESTLPYLNWQMELLSR
jgi:hypothetical protein